MRISLPQGGSVSLTAANIDRDPAAHLIQLKGNVEIKTAGRTTGRYTIIRADEAAYHEDTGELEARGSVSVKLDTQK